jgi:hypothetical protein
MRAQDHLVARGRPIVAQDLGCPDDSDDVERCARPSERRREIAGNNLNVVVAEEQQFTTRPLQRAVAASGKRTRIVDTDNFVRMARKKALLVGGDARVFVGVDPADEHRDARFYHAGRRRRSIGETFIS